MKYFIFDSDHFITLNESNNKINIYWLSLSIKNFMIKLKIDFLNFNN